MNYKEWKKSKDKFIITTVLLIVIVVFLVSWIRQFLPFSTSGLLTAFVAVLGLIAYKKYQTKYDGFPKHVKMWKENDDALSWWNRVDDENRIKIWKLNRGGKSK